MSAKFLKDLSGIGQTFVLLIFTIVLLTMAYQQIPIPQPIMDAYLGVLGFFFGARTAQVLNR